MAKQSKDSQPEITECPHCHAKFTSEIPMGYERNYCEHCGGAISASGGGYLLLAAYTVARDFPDIILFIDDKLRQSLNSEFSEKHGWKKLADPKDVLPQLVKKYNLDLPSSNSESSYLAQIVKELHDISLKLGDSIPTPEITKNEMEKPVPKKRGRPKKNPVSK